MLGDKISRSRRRWSAAAAAAVAATLALGMPVAWAGRSIYSPYPGATFVYDASQEQKVHFLEIDLTDKRIRLRVTSRDDALEADGSKHPMGPNQFAKKRNIQMAINGSIGGDPGDEPTMFVSGLVKGYGKMWPMPSEQLSIMMRGDVASCPQSDGTTETCSKDGLFAISADNQKVLLHTVAQLSFPDDNMVPAEYDIAAGGRPVIVWDGEVVDKVDPYVSQHDKCSPGACTDNPRTAYGVSEDKKTLLLMVVDGRREGCKGKTTKELGQLMKDNGAWWAFNLDGGGSSAMFVAGFDNAAGSTEYPAGIVNRPSDGSVRTVPLQIGVQVVQPEGHLQGVVRKGNPQSGTPIAGATVEVTYVDENVTKKKTATSSDTGKYLLSNVSAGTHVVTVTVAGYKTLSTQKLVAAGDLNRLHFGLAANGSAAAGQSKDGLAEPAADLEDHQPANTTLQSFEPIPPEQLAADDVDPDFPDGVDRTPGEGGSGGAAAAGGSGAGHAAGGADGQAAADPPAGEGPLGEGSAACAVRAAGEGPSGLGSLSLLAAATALAMRGRGRGRGALSPITRWTAGRP
jgi:hypothetical protein